MNSSRIFATVRSTTGTFTNFHHTPPTTRYGLIRASTYFSNAKENQRIWLDPNASASWQFKALLTAAAATMTGLASLMMLQQQHQQQLTPTLCDAQQARIDSEDDDEEDDDNFHDPMSSYAVQAIVRELKLQYEQQQQAAENTHEKKNEKDNVNTTIAKTPSASIQATSSSSSANDPFPLNPSDAFSDGSSAVPVLSEAEARIEEATRKAKQHSGGLKIFSGNGNMSLALEICRHLGVNLGKATVGRFADGEVNVVIHENVRGKDVYIVQPTCPPVNDNIMELLLMVSTLRRSSARRITVVIPYYGYARQDRKMQVRLLFVFTIKKWALDFND